jgi:hypothetical protein
MSWLRYLTEVATVFQSDAMILLIALIAIGVAESPRMRADAAVGGYFGLFHVLFELCSAYGSVGLSLGYPNTVTSLSAQFSTFSKTVMVLVMVYGYVSGLYPASDAAFVISPALLGQPLMFSSDLNALAVAFRANPSGNARQTDRDLASETGHPAAAAETATGISAGAAGIAQAASPATALPRVTNATPDSASKSAVTEGVVLEMPPSDLKGATDASEVAPAASVVVQ